ncbi:lysophospholipid acyltransferase family protein [Roseivirga sp. UBA1976]|uniref:lysophospholipid acyltransferase family protein n=1 Tax=Roseivirga sp. UBA1976 TaxID=1947386 RepID=UPI002580C8DB|nr:lysophospholipid acyltransferase family protein [Roseivirga sp. UBA1976]
MRRVLLRIYSFYGLLVFALIFLVLLPFFLLAIFIRPLEGIAPFINHVWARLFFFFLFLNRTRVIYRAKPKTSQRYIFCANHTSFLDIPSLGLINHKFKFIGKASLKKVPVWGFMYSRLHILVDRASLKSRHKSWLKAQEEIRRGFSVVFFPEGGILTKNPPHTVTFKEGSFRIAVNEQIPIVPVSIPYNHLLLPDKSPLTMHPGRIEMVVHEPIWPEGTGDEAVEKLKKEVRKVIEDTLNSYESR